MALHALNHGSHSWLIDDESLVEQIIGAKCGTKFVSNPFSMVGLKWRLEIYPNGRLKQYEGYFMIYLRLLTLPPCIDKMQICRVFRVIENQCSNIWIFTLRRNEYAYWNKKCPLSELIEMDSKTITIYVEVHIQKLFLSSTPRLNRLAMDKSYGKIEGMKRQLEYKLSPEELALFPDAKSTKQMSTDIIDNMWSISWYPNGCKDEYKGYVSVGLNIWRWDAWKSLSVSYTLYIFLIDFEEIHLPLECD